jgi:hypothetical protein
MFSKEAGNMKIRASCIITALLLSALCLYAKAADEESKVSTNFTQAVVEKAISFMPNDVKAKLTSVAKDIVAGANLKPQAGKAEAEIVYFVDKKDGSGPAMLAEEFRIVRKGVADKSAYSVLAPKLGKLAGYVIALSQPYHTDEAAFKGTAHAGFEESLDAAAASLKAESDGYQKVDNPSDYAMQLAKSANEQLKILGLQSSDEAAKVPSAVFNLAVNGVVDCWWTLLVDKSPAKTADAAGGSYIGNKRSLKLHLPTCKYLPAEKNRVYFKTREQALAEGYMPCKVCKP